MTATPPPPPPPLPPALGCSADSPLVVPDSPPWVGKPSHPGSCKRVFPQPVWGFSPYAPPSHPDPFGSPARSGLPPPHPDPKRRRRLVQDAGRRLSLSHVRRLVYTSPSPVLAAAGEPEPPSSGTEEDDDQRTPADQVSPPLSLPLSPLLRLSASLSFPPLQPLLLTPSAAPLPHLPPGGLASIIDLDDESEDPKEENKLVIETYGLCGGIGVCELPLATHKTPIELLYFCSQCNKAICGSHLQWDGKRVECMFCRHTNHDWLEQDHVHVRKARIHAFKFFMEGKVKRPKARSANTLIYPSTPSPPSPDLGTMSDDEEDLNCIPWTPY